MDKKLELYYEKPAWRWEETICLGNGRLGAMVWGVPGKEMLGLNEDSLWSGYESHVGGVLFTATRGTGPIRRPRRVCRRSAG